MTLRATCLEVEAGRRAGYNQPMRASATRLQAFLPAMLLMLFSSASGTFHGGAFGDWTLAGHLALLLFVAAFGEVWPDPLRLGRSGNVLLVAFLTTVVVSFWLSPVSRAGSMSLILLPAFFLVPSAVARCWATVEQRQLGLRSIAGVVVVIAGWSLFGWWRLETPGTSLPLGHHNLLAAWLLVWLPVVVVGWRERGIGRVIVGMALGLGIVSLVLTGSLGAAVAVGIVALLAAMRTRWGRIGLMIAGALVVLQGPRLFDVATGADFSTIARWSYAQAGWKGLIERPVFGWGPGAASWTLSEHFRPIPGIHPPDQVVADLHSVPMQIGYELGFTGLLLVTGLTIVWVRRRWVTPSQDHLLRRGAAVGLVTLALASCVGRLLAITALPLAAALCAGMVLAAEGCAGQPAGRRWPTAVAAIVMLWWVVPLDLAQIAYDKAVRAPSEQAQLQALQRARQLDPSFPLYRLRYVLVASSQQPQTPDLADEARRAAADARGLAAPWLIAGRLGQEVGASWSRSALLEACRTSPLGALAPFYLALEEAPGSTTRRSSRASSSAASSLTDAWAARAILAEPYLLAARAWQDRRSVLAAGVHLASQLESVDAGWRQELEETYLWLEEAPESSTATRRLALMLDGDDTTSVSLHAFRRQSWSAILAEIEVDADRVVEINLAAATELRSTGSAVFAAHCGLGSDP